MFFKLIYYLIGIGIIMYKSYRLSQPETTKDMWEVWVWHETAKKNKTAPTTTDGWKEKLGQDLFNSIVFFAIMAVIEASWMIVGLFTYNWALILAFIAYGLIFNRLMKQKLKNSMNTYVSSVNFNLYLTMAVILFAIINSFHLHIDLVKLIFGG
jgi:Flp pilus assembly protein TadB